jgi:hypothetical protein
MGKHSTPRFEDMMAARGGKGTTGTPSGKGSKMPPPPKSAAPVKKSGGKMPYDC